jgi:hypothetical protein
MPAHGERPSRSRRSSWDGAPVLQPDFVIFLLIAGLGEHLGTAEPPTPVQPVPVDTSRHRQQPPPSTGRATRERARRATRGRAGESQRAEPLITAPVALRSAERPRGCGRVPGLSWARRCGPGSPASLASPGRRRVPAGSPQAPPHRGGWVGCTTEPSHPHKATGRGEPEEPPHGAGAGRPGPGTARPPAAARPDSTRWIDTIAPSPTGGGA